ncbi:unnamed protein product, partial [Adineta ricciae]
MIVLLTLTINGTSSKYLVKILGLHHGTKESEIVLLRAFERIGRQTSWKLAKMKEDEKFADVDWTNLTEYLLDKLLEELDEENHTNHHQQLSRTKDEISSISTRQSFHQNTLLDYDLQMNSIVGRGKNFVPLIIDDNQHDKNIRNELITRFLTAMAIDYENQWYLAKQKCSLELHWKLILEHFRLSIFRRYLIKFDRFRCINQWTDGLFFDHIFQTIELTLSFHSAKTQLDNIRLEFPELSNLNERIMDGICDEVKTYQINAMYILFDLCWFVQTTRRCAQILLKYESIAIIQLYETGILADIELIENKLFNLEYGK